MRRHQLPLLDIYRGLALPAPSTSSSKKAGVLMKLCCYWYRLTPLETLPELAKAWLVSCPPVGDPEAR
jgi:hypothetical protein